MNIQPPEASRKSYRAIVTRQFRKNRVAVLGLVVVLVLFIVALAADFIANDKPLLMKYRGSLYSPVLKEYAVWLHLSQWPREFQNISFKEFVSTNFQESDWAWFPPIRYSQNDISLKDAIQPPSARHFLGTDEIGRDIASRMVHGARVSLSVGFVAVSIYVAIGMIIGALA